MFRLWRTVSVLIVLSHTPAAGVAQAGDARTLTIEQAITMARETSPHVLAARARVAEARGRLAAASLRLRGNPVLSGGAGRRTVDGEDFTDFHVDVTQGLGIAGQRRARIESAEAETMRETAEAEETARRQMRDVAVAFLRGLHARERLSLLEESAADAERIAASAERRLQAGDVAALDANLTAAALARARSEVLSARADLTDVMGTLSALLGLRGEPLTLAGDLSRTPRNEPATPAEQAAKRPDAVALAAAIAQAEADARAARTARRPEVDVAAGYEREEEADIVGAALSISLPFLDRGEGQAAAADARAARLVMERDALLRAAETEIATAQESYRQRHEAAMAIEATLPGIVESAHLATRSYETGQISLVDLLIMRGGLQETRRAHLDKLLEAAIAAIALETAAGVLR